MMATPSVLVFDVNETLLDIGTLEPLFLRLFGDAAVMREWFAQLVLHSQSATIAGAYAPFGVLGAGVLRMVGEVRGVSVTDADAAELKERTRGMPAHSDVLPALERLRGAGFRLATLTNSPPEPGTGPVDRTGIGRLVERQFSVHAVRRFKPAPEAYRQVSDAVELPPDAFCMVAAHAWDTLGAQSLGWAGALLTRPGNAALTVPGLPRPDLVASDMGALADAMIRMWR